jgi:hypothetical protein
MSIRTLGLLAAAVSAGCHSLQELDLSCNLLMPETGCSSSTSSADVVISNDQAWAAVADALVQPCCPQLRSLVLHKCTLGPASAAALTRLLKARSRHSLQKLELVQCAGMGEVSDMHYRHSCSCSFWSFLHYCHLHHHKPMPVCD